MKRHNCLSRVPVFAGLSDHEKDEVHAHLHPAHYKKGEYVIRANANKPHLLVLNRGNAKVTRTSRDGREQIVRLLGPGDYVGEMAVFTGQSSSSDVLATEDSSFCVLDYRDLEALISEKPHLSLHLLADMSRRLEQAEAYTELLGLDTVYNRLHATLIQMADGQTRFRLPVSKKDLAARIGTTPETLSRTLKKLENDNRILVTGRYITFI